MSKRRTFVKTFVILGAILLVAGVAVFVGGMTAGGWDSSILNTVRYTQKSYDAEGGVTSVHIEYSNAAISVEYSETAETVHIYYPVRLNERDEESAQIEITEKDGALTVVEHVDWQDSLFQWDIDLFQWDIDLFQWDIDLDFGDDSARTVRVVLPAGQNIALDLYTQNGSVSLNADGEALPSLSLRSNNGSISVSGTLTVAEDAAFQTDNGSVKVSGVSAAGDLTLRTSNGSMRAENISADSLEARSSNGSLRLTDIAAADSLTAKTNNGAIELLGDITAKMLTVSTSAGDIAMHDGMIDAQEIAMTTELGSIEAEGSAFAGAQSDYTVLVSTGLGESNVSDSVGGNRKLTLSTGTGDIRVYFES